MKLTLILACLWLDYYFDTGLKWRNPAWFGDYIRWIKSTIGEKVGAWKGPLSIVITLLPVVVILAILWSLVGRHSAVVELVVGFIVLWYCFGPTELQETLTLYLKKETDTAEAEQALKVAGADLMDPTLSFHRNVTELVFWQAHERFFGVIFWFLLLGPVGAVLFRMVSWMHETAPRMVDEFYPHYPKHIHQLYWIIAWIPSRLAAFSYSLVGNFLPGFDQWKNDLVKPNRCREVLIDTGLASLGVSEHADKEENLKAQGIVQRGLIVWIIVAAVATLSQAFIAY